VFTAARIAADMALWTALSNVATGRADLDVLRQALNVAAPVAGVPVPFCCRVAGVPVPAAGTGRVSPKSCLQLDDRRVAWFIAVIVGRSR
jgi:hypothetical protein